MWCSRIGNMLHNPRNVTLGHMDGDDQVSLEPIRNRGEPTTVGLASAFWPDEIDVEDVILDAAEQCFTDHGVVGTTIEDIATVAGVSRITVYRRIGSRDQLVLLVLLRILDRFLATLLPRLIAAPDLSAALVILIEATVRGVRSDDLRLMFASAEQGALGAPIPGASVPMTDRFGGIVSVLSDQFPAQLKAGIQSGEAGEWVLRVIISLLTVERTSRGTQRGMDSWLKTFVLPGLLAAEAGNAPG